MRERILPASFAMIVSPALWFRFRARTNAADPAGPGDDDMIRACASRFPTGGEESAPSRIFHSAVEGGGEPARAPNDCAAAGREGVETMRSALLWLIGIPIPNHPASRAVHASFVKDRGSVAGLSQACQA